MIKIINYDGKTIDVAPRAGSCKEAIEDTGICTLPNFEVIYNGKDVSKEQFTLFLNQTLEIKKINNKGNIDFIELNFLMKHFNISSINFSPDGQYLASGCQYGKIKIWDVTSGKELKELKGESAIYSVNFSPNGKLLAWGTSLNVIIWDMAREKRLLKKQFVNIDIPDIKFSNNSKLLAIGGRRNLLICNVATGLILKRVGAHSRRIDSIDFSANDALLASCSSDDNTIKIWDGTVTILDITKSFLLPLPNKELKTLYFESVNTINFSPDGRYLAASNKNGIIKIWDVDSGRNLMTLIGEGSSIDFSPDGKYLASGGNDIRIWDVQSGNLIRTLKCNNAWISLVKFSPDGKYFAAGSGDETIKLWEIIR